MKRKVAAFFVVLGLAAAVLFGTGIGANPSSSAVRDLKAELETIYGPEYAGRDTAEGKEDMVFVVEPQTWFLTNWNLRNALGMDYEYVCKVVFTTYTQERVNIVRTISYQAFDPMGAEKGEMRAHLVLDSKTETIENR